MSDESRLALFEKVKQAYLTHNFNVLVQAATGSGKTKIACDLSNLHAEDSWTILVPRKPLIKTWEDELIKWGYQELLSKLKILCYASAHKLLPGNNNIILDEAHRITDRSLPFVQNFKGTGKLIALSATIPGKKRELLEKLNIDKWNTIKYSLDDAVDDDVVADYNIKIIQFALDNATKNVQAGKKGAYFFTTEAQGYVFKDQRVRQAMYSQNNTSIKFAMLERMRFIYNLPSKLKLAHEVMKAIPADKKVIIFCGSILHANLMCQYRYHSKTDDADYNAFCEGKINRIAVVQGVNEGVNIPDLDYALLMQVQSESLHVIQKLGRLLRKSDDPDKVGKAIILEATGTQDSKWVANAMESFDKQKIDYISVTQFLNKGL